MLTKVKAALQEKRLHQYELARQVGITETRLSRIVRGRIEATIEEKRKLAQLLELPMDVLFSGLAPAPGHTGAQGANGPRRGKAST